MKRRFGRLVPVVVSAAVLVLLLTMGAGLASADKGPPAVGSATKALLFSSDGMRPDLMQRYAAAGAMPTYAQLMRNGVAATTA